MKDTDKKQNQDKPIKCVICGYPISPYYFTSIKDEKGNKITPKCQNCGHYEDPE